MQEETKKRLRFFIVIGLSSNLLILFERKSKLKKKYLLEQCKRLKLIHTDETIQYINDNNEWWVNHNKGHEILIDDFINYIDKTNQLDKNEVKKWLRKKMAYSNKIIKSLDIKYNLFINDEEMNEEDNYTYSLQDGIICISLTILEIVNKKKYISKRKTSAGNWT